MSTMATHSPVPSMSRPLPVPELRLALTPGGSRARLDGAWWPRTRRLSEELPALIAELDRSWGRITCVSVRDSSWARVDHEVPVGSHTIHVNWYDAGQDPDAISLFSYRIGRWELLVVPPGTEDRRAARLMAAVSRPGNDQSASSLIAHGPAPSPGPRQDRIRIRSRHTRSGSRPGPQPAGQPGPR